MLYAPYKTGTYPNFRQHWCPMLGKPRTLLCCLADGHGRNADWIGNWK